MHPGIRAHDTYVLMIVIYERSEAHDWPGAFAIYLLAHYAYIELLTQLCEHVFITRGNKRKPVMRLNMTGQKHDGFSTMRERALPHNLIYYSCAVIYFTRSVICNNSAAFNIAAFLSPRADSYHAFSTPAQRPSMLTGLLADLLNAIVTA